MSDRNKARASKLASLKIGYLTQIEILLDDKLSDREKIEAFAEAAGYNQFEKHETLRYYEANKDSQSAACLVWYYGHAQKSLFAYMPKPLNCCCPVRAAAINHPIAEGEEIPSLIPLNWRPNRATLEAFMRVQLKARSKNGPSRLPQSN